MSAKEWKKHNVYGLIIYSFYQKDGLKFEPGHICVNSKSQIKKEESKENSIFEKLFISVFKNVPANLCPLVWVSAFTRTKGQKAWNFYPIVD